MPLKKRNRVLLISVVLLVLLMFGFVFLRPSFLNKLISGKEGLPTVAKKQGFVIAKNQAETFALEVPAAWKVIQYPVSEGYISLLTVQSDDFRISSNPEDKYAILGASLESGMRLDISVTGSHEEYVPKPVNTIKHQENYISNDLKGTYYIYGDAGLSNADYHELRFAKNGRVYFVKMTFNPQKNPDGEKLFRYILSTLVIK